MTLLHDVNQINKKYVFVLKKNCKTFQRVFTLLSNRLLNLVRSWCHLKKVKFEDCGALGDFNYNLFFREFKEYAFKGKNKFKSIFQLL